MALNRLDVTPQVAQVFELLLQPRDRVARLLVRTVYSVNLVRFGRKEGTKITAAPDRRKENERIPATGLFQRLADRRLVQIGAKRLDRYIQGAGKRLQRFRAYGLAFFGAERS